MHMLVTHSACIPSKRHISVASLLMTSPSDHGPSIICIVLKSAVTSCRSCLRGETRWRAGQPNLRAGARALQHAWQLLAPHFTQTQAAVPPALPPPCMRGPRVAPVSSLASARCLAPQARLLQIRWVLSDCWAQWPPCEPYRLLGLPLPYVQLFLNSNVWA